MAHACANTWFCQIEREHNNEWNVALMPATFLIAYLTARRIGLQMGGGAAMLLDVWLTGGLFMALSATVPDGGFAGPDGVRGGIFKTLLGVIPPLTFMEATYDGGRLALLAVTLGGLLFWGGRTSGEILPGESPGSVDSQRRR
jgi:hypothetical protein